VITVEATAPGKAVLIGEYAVLEGAPAIAMAVDRHARIRIESCASDQCQVRAEQLGIAPVSFRINADEGLDWDVSAPGWPRLQQTASLLSYLHGLVVQRFGDPGPFQIDIDTAELFLESDQGTTKVGLGSSSAVAVALDAGLRRFAGGPHASGLSMRALKRLLTPYRRGQDGQGSGIDLATSLCGGVISYRKVDGQAQVERISLPESLILMFVWTGQPASTSDMLSQFRQWRTKAPEQAGQLLGQMQSVSEAALQAVRQVDAEALIEAFAAYGRLMGTMGSLMGANVMTAEHRRILAHSESLGLAYKPSGAGGGDLGMVAGTDPGQMHEMGRWLEDEGLRQIILQTDGTGVETRVDTSGQDPALT
jgi:phosphomevalonate kinase